MPHSDQRDRHGTDDGARTGFEADLRAALDLAVRAPSIHNSQPWRWRISPEAVELHVDPTRRLVATDPDGRDLVVSCGAALHHLLVALADAGQGTRVRRLPDPARPDHLATIEPAPDVDVDIDRTLAAEIGRRVTERRPFRSWPVPPELVGELVEIGDRQGVRVDVVTDPRARRRLFRAVEAAAQRQDDDPAYGVELAEWSGRSAGDRDGVPADRAPAPGRVPGRMPMRAFAGTAAADPSDGGPESATLLLLSTPTDTPLQWLRVGEVTSAILLTASRLGLAASPLTQPLEIGETRAFVRDHVAATTSRHPQMVLRIGWPPAGGAPVPPTPRRPLDEVVER
jgi:nitroreductase